MFKCCLGARPQVNKSAYQPPLDQSSTTHKSSKEKVENNTVKTQTPAASSAAGAGSYSFISAENLDRQTREEILGRKTQVQPPAAPSTVQSRQEIINKLENFMQVATFKSGEPSNLLSNLIQTLKKNNPEESDLVSFFINNLQDTLKDSQIQGLSSLLEQCRNELMINPLEITKKNVVNEFIEGYSNGIKAGVPKTLKKLDQLRKVETNFPHYIACQGDGTCAYTAMVKGTLLQLSKSPSPNLDNFLKEIIDYLDRPIKIICDNYLNKKISVNEFFQEINSNANYEAAIVKAAKSRVINELVTVFKKRTDKEYDNRILWTDTDEAFFLVKVDEETLAMAEKAGVGIEEAMTFEERIARIKDGNANQVSAQEINMFAHVFGQSFLDIDLSNGKIELKQYPLTRGQQSKTFDTHDSNEQFALLMKTNGHHDVVLKSNRYGN